jgi:hypothetical protein
VDVVLKNWRVLAIAALAFPFAGSASLAAATLYAADNLTNFPASGIVQVDTGSLLETGTFLTAGAIAGVASDGTDVFVSLPTGISEYTTAGAFVGSFANGPGDSFGALALAGDTLYAADNLTNFPASGIVQVDTGSLLETGDFLTSGAVASVATDGTDIFVSLPTGISEYTTAGVPVGSFTNNVGDSFGALALASNAVARGTRSLDMGDDGARFCGSKFRRFLADADAFRLLGLEFGGYRITCRLTRSGGRFPVTQRRTSALTIRDELTALKCSMTGDFGNGLRQNVQTNVQASIGAR